MFQFQMKSEDVSPVETCKSIDNYASTEMYNIIDYCNDLTTDSSTVEKCADTGLTEVGKVPVSNLLTGVTFQNIYCAICHGQYTEVTRWRLSVYCNPSKHISDTRGIELDVVTDCQRSILKPTSVALKACSPLMAKRERREAQITLNQPNVPKQSFLGFTTLLNFGVDGSLHTLYTADTEGSWFKSECDETQIYIPISNECLQRNCPQNHISINGKCVEQRIVRQDGDAICVDMEVNYFLNDSFPKFDEEGFKQSLVTHILAQHKISGRDILFPSKVFSNVSQCSKPGNFYRSYLMHNISNIKRYPEPELQYNFEKHEVVQQEKNTAYSNFTSMSHGHRTGTLIVSLKFTKLDLKQENLKNMLAMAANNATINTTLLFSIKDSNGSVAGQGRVSSMKTQNMKDGWCNGFTNHYFNEEFELLCSGKQPCTTNITGIQIMGTNKTFNVSHFQYTAVLGNGTLWKNITRMASTCDELPSIKSTTRGLCDLKLPLGPEQYELLPNRSIRVDPFVELSSVKLPFGNGTPTHIPSLFNLDEYEYLVWNVTDNSSGSAPMSNLAADQAVSICMPQELYILLVELELWKSINIKPSCAYMRDFGWGSSVAGLVCSAISMVAMVLVLLTYGIFKTLRTLPGVSLMNLTVAVMLSQVTFFISSFMVSSLEDKSYSCFTMAVFTHYCTLSSFMWMNVMAYSSYRAFGADLKTRLSQLTKKHLVFNSLYGWGIPGMIVLVCALVDYTHRKDHLIEYGVVSDVIFFTEKNKTTGLIDDIQVRYRTMAICWIGNSKAAFVIFGAPLIYSMVINLVLFIKTCIG